MGVADPLFMGELALEMHMPVGELGERMSNHELCVFWPAFFETREQIRKADEEKQRGRGR